MELKQGGTIPFARAPCRVAYYGSSAGSQAVLDARRKKQLPFVRIRLPPVRGSPL
jgi:hypothetical protein